MNPSNAHCGCRSGGFSLVELMIALTLGLLIMAAILGMYVDMSRTNQEMAKTNSQIENARFALQFLQSDIVHGGYWGGFVPAFDDLSLGSIPSDAPALLPNLCLAYSSPWNTAYIDSLIGIPIQSFDAAPPGCTSVVANLQPDTDVLVVRHAGTCVPGASGCEADVVGKLYFQASFCELESATRYLLGTSALDLHGRGCVAGTPIGGPLAPKRRFVSNIYYIRNFSVSPGDGIPTLVRSEFDLAGSILAHQPAVALIEGIQGFRVELGIDNLGDTGAATDYTAAIAWADPDNHDSPTNRGDGSPDGAFVRCTTASPCNVAQLSDVVAVQIFVLVRANTVTPGYTDTRTYILGSTTLGPFNDGFKRHVFSRSVRLVNVSGRRETP